MDAMIRLENLTKRYPGQAEVAVDDVTMEIPEGEVVVFVGPSGCGKTTTLKMINRLIEPTEGRIFLEGEDVTDADPDLLRRRIGYVIQQVGLFRHKTIADNVGTVPRLLGWDKERIDQRVDELLDMVGMDPETYRHRYPKELSGGQRQRVGVARAMAADPPVLLMDEPFGAIDPITRERLQNEFLRLQEQIHKTIAFVTHDIDEAVKMGDRIAIFNNDHRIAQFDRPEVLLTGPADEFVEEFIGIGAAVKRLHLSRVRDVDIVEWPTAPSDADRETITRLLADSTKSWVLVLDEHERPARWVGSHDPSGGRVEELDVSASINPDATLYEALDQMLGSRMVCAPVVDQGTLLGVVDIETLAAAIHAMRGEGGDGDGEGQRAAEGGRSQGEAG